VVTHRNRAGLSLWNGIPRSTQFLDNVVNNNNITWKNFTIVDEIPNGGNAEIGIFVGNPTKEPTKVRIVFRSPEVAAISAAPTRVQSTAANVLQWGTVKVDLGNTLFSKWSSVKDAGTGVTVDTDRAVTIKVTEANAKIEEITLGPGEKHLIKVIFTPFEKSVDDKNQYHFDVIQYNFDGKAFKETGGVRFVVKPPNTDVKQ